MTTINSLEILLKPYIGLDKIRVGSTFDGGYILPKASITKCKRVLSFGISTNIDFELKQALSIFCKKHGLKIQSVVENAIREQLEDEIDLSSYLERKNEEELSLTSVFKKLKK